VRARATTGIKPSYTPARYAARTEALISVAGAARQPAVTIGAAGSTPAIDRMSSFIASSW
jgi:hypothetical protein